MTRRWKSTKIFRLLIETRRDLGVVETSRWNSCPQAVNRRRARSVMLEFLFTRYIALCELFETEISGSEMNRYKTLVTENVGLGETKRYQWNGAKLGPRYTVTETKRFQFYEPARLSYAILDVFQTFNSCIHRHWPSTTRPTIQHLVPKMRGWKSIFSPP